MDLRLCLFWQKFFKLGNGEMILYFMYINIVFVNGNFVKNFFEICSR